MRLLRGLLYRPISGVIMEGAFLAMLFRMKYINRWGLMRNSQTENLSQHTLECAFLAHYLASVGNKHFGKNYNAEKIAVYAMFHDCAEILTGDLPTPVKYHSEQMKSTYAEIENIAAKKLLSYLPDDMEDVYSGYITGEGLDEKSKKLIKQADKLCAYIKCIEEINAGNKEFSAAFSTIKAELEKSDSSELKFFLEKCLPSFSLSLDELKGTL